MQYINAVQEALFRADELMTVMHSIEDLEASLSQQGASLSKDVRERAQHQVRLRHFTQFIASHPPARLCDLDGGAPHQFVLRCTPTSAPFHTRVPHPLLQLNVARNVFQAAGPGGDLRRYLGSKAKRGAGFALTLMIGKQTNVATFSQEKLLSVKQSTSSSEIARRGR